MYFRLLTKTTGHLVSANPQKIQIGEGERLTVDLCELSDVEKLS